MGVGKGYFLWIIEDDTVSLSGPLPVQENVNRSAPSQFLSPPFKHSSIDLAGVRLAADHTQFFSNDGGVTTNPSVSVDGSFHEWQLRYNQSNLELAMLFGMLKRTLL